MNHHGTRRLDWELEDPKDQPLECVRTILDDVRQRVVALLRESGWFRLAGHGDNGLDAHNHSSS